MHTSCIMDTRIHNCVEKAVPGNTCLTPQNLFLSPHTSEICWSFPHFLLFELDKGNKQGEIRKILEENSWGLAKDMHLKYTEYNPFKNPEVPQPILSYHLAWFKPNAGCSPISLLKNMKEKVFQLSLSFSSIKFLLNLTISTPLKKLSTFQNLNLLMTKREHIITNLGLDRWFRTSSSLFSNTFF